MTDLDLDRALEFAREVALEAGAIQMDGLGAAVTTSKGIRRELVTPIDHACEALIIGRIRSAYPDHGYFAEEGHVAEGAWRWIVDPLDGTTNYAHRLPLFSVSIGLQAPDGEMVMGVVCAPALDEMFWARTGGGAWGQRGGREPRRLAVSETAELADAVLATGFAYVRNETQNTNLDNWAAFSPQVRGLRRMGSAAIDLAYVADGRFDAFWEMHLKPYDVAAGVVLIREAGGQVTDMFLGETWLEGQTIIASNRAIHARVHEALAPVRDDPWVERPKGSTRRQGAR